MVTKNHAKTMQKPSFSDIGKKTIGSVVEGLPVQAAFRTMQNQWKINIFMALSHVSIVSPLMRDLGLHGYLKTLEILGKSKVLGDAGKMKIRLAN